MTGTKKQGVSLAQKWLRQALIHTCVAGMVIFFTGRGLVAGSGPFIEKKSDGVTIVRLTQVACLFLESEENPQNYTSTKKQDCEEINRKTLKSRKLKTLTLKPGKYIFRVTNKNVSYELGFWIRGQGLGRVTLPSVSGGGLTIGETRDYEITLVKGDYAYRCPLNPTPDYSLIVR